MPELVKAPALQAEAKFIEPTEPIPKPGPVPEDEPEAKGHGRFAWLLVAGLLAALALVVATHLVGCGPSMPAARAAVEKGADGSTAGANAATKYDIEWEAGIHSVTQDDLGREYELGRAYPANGKEAWLASDTTYGRGAGMVDVVTFDKATNVEIRHYGQLREDGTVRWYAAETVLDAEGVPISMERE